MTDDCKVCNSIYDVREGGESTGYCDPCAQDRVAELEAREPLVEEILRLQRLYAQGEDAPIAILQAVHKLAGWTP